MRYRALVVAFLALCLGFLTACSDGPAVAADREQLTYDEILGTGLANKCPQISEFTRGTIAVEPGKSYLVSDLCLEPQEYFVKEEPKSKRQEAEFIPGKLLTRDTTSLEQITGTITVDNKGVLTFTEEEGIDFQPVTEPGFTAINSSVDFEGQFNVPSYRGAGFLDPKGRGVYTGYDTAVALPASGDEEEYARANVKETDAGTGTIYLQVSKVDGESGEIAGVFESVQPSDTDLGARDAVDVKIRGTFYARVEPKA
jgi:photosystem II oxygen-evolving enhancer protein 1